MDNADPIADLALGLVEYWAERLEMADEHGKRVPLSAAEAKELREFIKDNGYRFDFHKAKEASREARQLLEQLPFEPDQPAPQFRRSM